MKNLVVLLVLILATVKSLWSQIPNCDCKSDLDFIVEKLKSTPSYKKQIKGDKLLEFENTYNTIVSKLTDSTDINTCYKFLQQQLDVIDDFHINLYSNTTYFSSEALDDTEKIEEFLKNPVFKKHPKYHRDLDSLRQSLSHKPSETIEGIYKFGSTSIEVGLIESSENQFEGVVIHSEHPLWKPGQVLVYVSKNSFDRYNLLQYDIVTRQIKMNRNIRFENGRLVSFKKKGFEHNFEFKLDKTSNWEFKQLYDKVQYIYFGSFSNATDNIKAFKAFHSKYKNSFTAPNIIIDLRSNGGGNSKWSDPFLKVLRKSKAKIYVITNQFTGSNGEQFTLKLKDKLNAVHLGQTTFGVIAYGINYSYTYNTPSDKFTIMPTDMNYHKYIAYEGHGITPDIPLNFDEDWIEQTMQIIENDTKK